MEEYWTYKWVFLFKLEYFRSCISVDARSVAYIYPGNYWRTDSTNKDLDKMNQNVKILSCSDLDFWPSDEINGRAEISERV